MRAQFVLTYKQVVEVDFPGNSGAEIKDFHDFWVDENEEFQNYVIDEIEKQRQSLPKPKFHSISLTRLESDEQAEARKHQENNKDLFPF